jgi:hypothetical protein
MQAQVDGWRMAEVVRSMDQPDRIGAQHQSRPLSREQEMPSANADREYANQV